MAPVVRDAHDAEHGDQPAEQRGHDDSAPVPRVVPADGDRPQAGQRRAIPADQPPTSRAEPCQRNDERHQGPLQDQVDGPSEAFLALGLQVLVGADVGIHALVDGDGRDPEGQREDDGGQHPVPAVLVHVPAPAADPLEDRFHEEREDQADENDRVEIDQREVTAELEQALPDEFRRGGADRNPEPRTRARARGDDSAVTVTTGASRGDRGSPGSRRATARGCARRVRARGRRRCRSKMPEVPYGGVIAAARSAPSLSRLPPCPSTRTTGSPGHSSSRDRFSRPASARA